MEIRRLKHLVALADTRNFGRAAQQCHLSQPAFSRSIQSAEEEMGLLLFDRGAGEVRCTDAGAFVVERARKLVFDSRCLERDVGMYRERLVGDVAFGVGPFPTATMIPALLTQMRTLYAGIKVRVEVNNAHYLAEHLRAEELDFYVADLRNVPATSDFEVVRIGQLTAGYYVRSGHPLLATPSVTGPDLMPYGLASVHAPEAVMRAMAPLMGMPAGSLLSLSLECDDLHLLKTVAAQTDTVLVCPDASAVQEVAQKRLVRLQVQGLPPVFSDMGVVSLKGRSFSLIAQFAVDFLTELGKK
jgi:DNA-binding transcriptional LysR family regulator